MRLPLRARLALISTAMTAVVLAAAGAFVYLRLGADLLRATDAGLRSSAEAIVGGLGRTASPLAGAGTLIPPDEAFAQVLSSGGEILAASPGLEDQPLLGAGSVASLRRPRFSERTVRGPEGPIPVRLLAVPAGDGRVVVAGASLDDRGEALARLAVALGIGGPVALALAAGAGWLVAGAALRPVERMRAEAAAISADDAGRRLPVPATRDELARLGETLNEMLERLSEALEHERRFVSDASHELRTPLANLKAEIELALRRSRTEAELLGALRSAGQETDRVVRLAESLLVLARADRGEATAVREPVDVAALVEGEVATFAGRASERRVAISSDVPAGLRASLDPLRVRQALGNMLDNAVRHSPDGGTVTVRAHAANGSLSLEVTDAGEGFPPGFLPHAFEPFARPDPSRSRVQGGAGLGLAIVHAVARAHGGTAEAANRPEGGALVRLTIPV